MTSTSFRDLGLVQSLLHALDKNGFETPTPIQSQAIPYVLDGNDLLGIAQTGTGKTAAFALPLLQGLSGPHERLPRCAIRALILAPTRELAVQIDTAIKQFSHKLQLTSFAVLGGVGRGPQVKRLSRGVDIVVGTPGRIRDLMSTRDLRLDFVTHFVLDEADRMLDLGFIGDIKHIASKIPEDRQTLLFSATMPDSVRKLADGLLTDPVRVEVSRDAIAPAQIDQHVYFVDTADKRALLTDLLQDPAITSAIVFTRTKHGADKVERHLEKAGIKAEALHGNKRQNARQKSLERFRSGKARVMVATDIAARGIDIEGVSHVINFDLPNEPESYVHRIGRTARAGADGMALSFCDASEAAYLRNIERLTGQKLTVAGGTPPADSQPSGKSKGNGRGKGKNNGGRRGNPAGKRPGKPRNRKRYRSAA